MAKDPLDMHATPPSRVGSLGGSTRSTYEYEPEHSRLQTTSYTGVRGTGAVGMGGSDRGGQPDKIEAAANTTPPAVATPRRLVSFRRLISLPRQSSAAPRTQSAHHRARANTRAIEHVSAALDLLLRERPRSFGRRRAESGARRARARCSALAAWVAKLGSNSRSLAAARTRK